MVRKLVPRDHMVAEVDFFVIFEIMTRKSTFSYGGILIKSPYEK
jgi:hypothetical protein